MMKESEEKKQSTWYQRAVKVWLVVPKGKKGGLLMNPDMKKLMVVNKILFDGSEVD